MKDWDDWNRVAQHAVNIGSYVVECSFLAPYERDWGNWHRSKDRKGGKNSFASYMTNKKWTLEEEFSMHLLIFQQVTVSYYYLSKLHFDIPDWIDSPRSSFPSRRGEY